jgi:amino acid adenylation domain-containing protein/FkbM family methyltransferase/non-ribosomal peptide synthase protein (TIGR01720 family)
VLLLYPPGLDYVAAFFGCLYAGAVAVPAYPPRRNRNMLRLESIVKDAQATAALTTTALLNNIAARFDEHPHIAGLRWLTSDERADGAESLWQRPDISSDTLAFLQYTSGSTSTPKGVMLSHRNLLHNEQLIQRTFQQTEESVIVGWLPLYHDMGLIGNVIQPLFIGAQCVLMSPMTFLQSPVRWLQAITRYKATTSGGPNFAYELCVRKINAEQRASLDLSSWSVAFNGAEPIRHETLEAFSKTFEPCGFRRMAFNPCYGLAEATLLVSGSVNSEQPVLRSLQARALENNRIVDTSSIIESSQPREADRTIVGCGGALPEVNVLIVDPETLNACPPDRIGEIWVSGPSVARGYWNRPQETAQTFNAFTASTGEGPFLRTGDLGFVRNGQLFVTGRLKDLVIIRGLNYYPQDIELSVERCNPAFRPGCGAAFSVEVAGEERLIVVEEVTHRRRLDTEALAADICEAVADEHQLQVHAIAFIKPGTIPKTSSGKIQRHACRAAFLDRSLDLLGEWQANATSQSERLAEETTDPRGEQSIEDWLRAQVALKLGVDSRSIDLNRSITRYGLDSLMALELAHNIESELGVAIPLSDLMQSLSFIQLADEIRSRSMVAATTPERALVSSQAVAVEHRLSVGQQALWFLYEMFPSSPAYNIGGAVRVLSDLNIAALRQSLQSLVDRHPTLRATFTSADGSPVQRIHSQSEVDFRHHDASSWGQEFLDNTLVEESQRPFVLEQGPLLRVRVFSQSASEHVLMLVMNHIIGDFWSLTVLVHELGILYNAECVGAVAALEPPALQYSDYVRWQDEMLASEKGERLWSYWKEQLAGDLPALNLPTRGQRPPVQTYKGASLSFRLGAETTQQLKALASRYEATLYMILLAAYQALLSRYTNQEDILIGSPTANRNLAALRGLVGYLTNLVVMRADAAGDPAFEDFLSRVRRTVLDAFEHQEFPFRLLVDRLEPTRDLSRPPLCQVAFVLHKAPARDMEGFESLAAVQTGTRMKLAGLEIESLALKEQVAPFDMTLNMAESNGELIGSLQYNTGLFDEAMISRMAEHFQNILRAITANPSERVSTLSLLTEIERNQIIAKWNDTYTEYTQDQCLHHLFEQQAARTPDNLAVIFEGQSLTYRELNSSSNQLAHYLQSLGIEPEMLVGAYVERSLEMVVGLMGILKAGAAYVPLDPSYPTERVAFMMADARVSVLLTQQHLVDRLPEHNVDVICLDSDWQEIARRAEVNPTSVVTVDNLAYMIYTSGSTGRPKGAMNTHRGITNRLEWMQEFFQLTEADRVMQKTPLSFDVSVWELFWTLTTGAVMIVAKPAGHQDSAYLVNEITRQKVTTLHFVPSMLQAFLEEPEVESCSRLKRVICSGEALSAALQDRFFHLFKDVELYNLYGPTEAAVDVTCWQCRRDSDKTSVPIGMPIANIQMYILDKHFNPVPVGVCAELYIGGTGVGRGYHNRPELTAEKFIPDPFSQERGARLYRSGDLARHLVDGNIEFLGRIDHQVKIRGNRIELAEIEAVLLQHPCVSEALVMARSDNGGSTRLVAYVVADEAQAMAMPDNQLYRLPNGLEIAHLNRNETVSLYKEIFEDYSYLKNGITIEDGDCIFDVGANIGLFTLHAHQECANAQVHAFEPIPPVFKLLKANVELYGLDVKLFNCGLSDETRRAEFTHYPKSSLMSGAYAQAVEDEQVVRAFLSNQDESLAEYANDLVEGRFEAEKYQCDLMTLSQIISENQIDKIDLLKIDVEKSELDVLRGIRREDWKKIRQIAIEVHDIDGRLEEIKGLLESQGYDLVITQDDLLKNTPLYSISAVRQSAAKRPNKRLQPDKNGGSRLELKKSIIKVSQLHGYLKERLPIYMLPSAFVLLKDLPTTPNGKVDRRALPAPGGLRPDLAADFTAPRNSTEQKLAEIWAEVLKVERVGIHDNFFELGGDSILSLQIISRANRAGMRLAPMQMFQHQTIAALASVAVVAAQESEQHSASGLIPLMPSQCQILEEQADAAGYFTNTVLLEARQPLDASLLRQAIEHLFAHHDALRLRFELRQRTWQQSDAERESQEVFSYVDLSSVPEIERVAFIESITLAVQSGMNLSEGPLMRVALFDSGNAGRAKLLLVAHQLVADLASCRILLEDLQQAYSQLSNGREIALAPRTGSFKQWAESVKQYVESNSLEESLSYWLENGSTPEPRLPMDYPQEINTTGSTRTVSVALNTEQTQALLGDVLTTHRAQLSETLLTALALGIQAWSRSRLLRIDVEASGREEITSDLGFSRTVGAFAATYPLLLDLGKASTAGDALKWVKEQVRRVPQRGFSFALLRHLGEENIKQSLRSLTAAELSFKLIEEPGNLSQGRMWPMLSSQTCAQTLNPNAKRRYIIEVTAGIFDGQLQTMWTYSENLHERATIEKLADAFTHTLNELISDAQSKEAAALIPSDFPLANLDRRKLNKLSTFLNKKVKSEPGPYEKR